MQGVTLLISGYVFLAVLAAPAVLFAGEPAPVPYPEAPAAQPDTGSDPTQPGVEVEPEATGKETGKDAAGSSDPDSAPNGPTGAPAEAGADKGQRSGRSGKRKRANAAAVLTVSMKNIKFHPRNVTIDPGDTVRWENRDEEKHNALGEDNSFHTPVIGQGESSEHTFEKSGKFPYFCSLHQGMTGKITVAGSGGGGSGSGGTGSRSGGTSTSSGTSSGTTGFGSGGFGSGGTTSSLPSTGQDLLWLVLAGTGLVTLGAALRLLIARRY